jgi:carboxyl-terminal processing protease
MAMKKYFIHIIIVLTLGTIIGSCQKDPDPVPEVKKASDAHKFVFDGLSTYYLWEDKIGAFHNAKYDNADSLNAFLVKFEKPEDLFQSLLYEYGTVDKWSFISDDSKEIENWIAGISESVGADFKLYYISEGSNDLIGVIRYVLKGSPAEKAGLKRGDLFLKINDQQLTVSNYQTLLYTLKNVTFGLASFNGSGFVSNGKSVPMTAVLLQENPILIDTVLNISNIKVGYLVYNGFISAYDSVAKTSYDIELNKVFGKFKNSGIQKLIVDLRYNGGGVVTTAIYMASMIYSNDTKKIFSKMQFNNFLQSYYVQKYGADYLNDYFENIIPKTSKMPEATINSLGLNQVYIITTSESASASELVINGLDPYISVIQVGSNTYGKYAGSNTIKDYIDNNGTVNPKHSYVMQPITFKTSNSLNVSDYVNGLAPDISAKEYAAEMLPFCDPNEPLLKACLDNIRGTKSATLKKGVDLKGFITSDDFSPIGRNMIMNGRFEKEFFKPGSSGK